MYKLHGNGQIISFIKVFIVGHIQEWLKSLINYQKKNLGWSLDISLWVLWYKVPCRVYSSLLSVKMYWSTFTVASDWPKNADTYKIWKTVLTIQNEAISSLIATCSAHTVGSISFSHHHNLLREYGETWWNCGVSHTETCKVC